MKESKIDVVSILGTGGTIEEHAGVTILCASGGIPGNIRSSPSLDLSKMSEQAILYKIYEVQDILKEISNMIRGSGTIKNHD